MTTRLALVNTTDCALWPLLLLCARSRHLLILCDSYVINLYAVIDTVMWPPQYADEGQLQSDMAFFYNVTSVLDCEYAAI